MTLIRTYGLEIQKVRSIITNQWVLCSVFVKIVIVNRQQKRAKNFPRPFLMFQISAIFSAFYVLPSWFDRVP